MATAERRRPRRLLVIDFTDSRAMLAMSLMACSITAVAHA
jgi:hypothetical protein